MWSLVASIAGSLLKGLIGKLFGSNVDRELGRAETDLKHEKEVRHARERAEAVPRTDKRGLIERLRKRGL